MNTTVVAKDAADRLARKLTDPASFTGGAKVPPYNLASGAAGIALLHAERARTRPDLLHVAHVWLKRATSVPVTAAGSADIFTGAPAIGHLLTVAARATGGYTRALDAVDKAVDRLTRARLNAAELRIGRGDGLRMHEYDLVHGLTGLGAYHLRRHPEHPLTRAVLDYLIGITQQTTPGPSRPVWWAVDGTNGQAHADFPDGHGNLGVSHGVSGPLALLSRAVLHGLDIPGAKETIEEICAWIDRWRQPLPDGGSWWPGYLTIENLHIRAVAPTQQPRPSWCYGISGIARAQQLAGLALADTARQHQAETAMLAAIRSSDHTALGNELGVCHGLAGMIQASWRMAGDAGSSDLTDALQPLTEALVTATSALLTDPSLMEGAAGVALVLHSVSSTTAAETTAWDGFLLLS